MPLSQTQMLLGVMSSYLLNELYLLFNASFIHSTAKTSTTRHSA